VKRISYAEFSLLRSDSSRLLDVREPHEFAQVHVKGAEAFPLSWIKEGRVPEKDERQIFVICRSGARSQVASLILESKGFPECTNVDGGTLAAMALGDDHVE